MASATPTLPSAMTGAPLGALKSYALTTYDRVFFVRWNVLPRFAELDALVGRARQLRASLGRPLVYLAVIPEHVDVPQGATREALAEFGHRISAHVEIAYLVIEGEGLRIAVQRSVVTAIYALRRDMAPVRVRSTLDQALDEIAGFAHLDAMDLRRGLGA